MDITAFTEDLTVLCFDYTYTEWSPCFGLHFYLSLYSVSLLWVIVPIFVAYGLDFNRVSLEVLCRGALGRRYVHRQNPSPAFLTYDGSPLLCL